MFTDPGRTSNLYLMERDNAMLSTEMNESMDLEEGIRACKVRESLKANCENKPQAKKIVKDKEEPLKLSPSRIHHKKALNKFFD
jgi:hypothetical protein